MRPIQEWFDDFPVPIPSCSFLLPVCSESRSNTNKYCYANEKLMVRQRRYWKWNYQLILVSVEYPISPYVMLYCIPMQLRFNIYLLQPILAVALCFACGYHWHGGINRVGTPCLPGWIRSIHPTLCQYMLFVHVCFFFSFFPRWALYRKASIRRNQRPKAELLARLHYTTEQSSYYSIDEWIFIFCVSPFIHPF